MSSLYIHIPFCLHICSYCDFAKVFYRHDWADDYLDALLYEIKDKNLNDDFDTIYIGGGTPSSLTLRQLEKLLKMIAPLAKKVKEYSIEVNPESMNEEKLDLLKKYGINRLSIGVQTFHDPLLANIERFHTSKQAIELIKQAKMRGFNDINIDLIYGLPNQTLEDIYEDIEIIQSLDLPHISIYSLILEENTILKNQNYQPLSEEEDAYWYDQINEKLKNIGFHHYEVSNYYKQKPSLHNLTYWHYQDYEGIGLSAHSLKEHYRYENTKSLSKYLRHDYLYEKTKLDKDDELFEKIMMGLRLTEGICLEEIEKIYHIDLMKKYEAVIGKYTKLGMLEINNTFLRTTSLGMKYLNTILVDFLD